MYSVIKRVFDFLLSLFLIIIFSPIMLFLYFFIKIKIDKDPIFRQLRPGKDERIFEIYKFKTMNDLKDENNNLLPDDQRLGFWGKKIRSTSLDELPQLFNILKGDMSFIGPRPLLIKYLDIYTPTQKLRHNVRPGISGLAQVKGRNAISWKKKFKYDVFYVKHLSMCLDIKILFLTIYKVLKKDGINKEGNVTTEEFNGNN